MLVDTTPNEFKPILLCNCVLQNCVILEIDPYELSHDFFNERIIAATSNFQGMSAKKKKKKLWNRKNVYGHQNFLFSFSHSLYCLMRRINTAHR